MAARSKIPSRVPCRAWLASIGAHAFALLACVAFLSWHAYRQAPESERSEPPRTTFVKIEVEAPQTLDGSGRSAGASRGSKASRARGAPQGSSAPRLSDLGVRMGIDVARRRETEADLGTPKGTSRFQAESEGAGLYQYLYGRIDDQLTYPEEFKNARIEGRVHARVAFSPDGRYLRELSSFSSESPYLRVHVIRMLRRAFADHRFPEGFAKLLSRNVILDCFFHFQITEHDFESVKSTMKLLNGTEMSFYRNFFSSKLQWELGPLSGMAPIPVVNFNPLWVVKKAADALSNKAKFDPLQKYRDDPEF